MRLLLALLVAVGANAGVPLPDLVIDRQHLIDTLTVDTKFYVDECLIDVSSCCIRCWSLKTKTTGRGER